jgi:glutathione synthase/RimK-type ligase-like ATP-grasp enzyme
MIIRGINGKETALEIAGALGDNVFKSLPEEPVSPRMRKWVLRNGIPTYLIRWGCATKMPYVVPELNSRGAIILASDKGRAREVMLDKKVDIPAIVTNFNDESLYPIIIRPRHHRAGMGFYFFNNPKEFRASGFKFGTDAHYAASFFNKSREFRAYIAHGALLAVDEKIPREEGNRKEKIWNHANGMFIFQNVRQGSVPRSIRRSAKEAIDAIGLDFGAVDIMHDNGAAKVLEINTAPTFTGEYLIGKFATYFRWAIDNIKDGCFPPHINDAIWWKEEGE